MRTKVPVGREYIDQCERDGEDAEQDVGYCQVGDEDVPCSHHGLQDCAILTYFFSVSTMFM